MRLGQLIDHLEMTTHAHSYEEEVHILVNGKLYYANVTVDKDDNLVIEGQFEVKKVEPLKPKIDYENIVYRNTEDFIILLDEKGKGNGRYKVVLYKHLNQKIDFVNIVGKTLALNPSTYYKVIAVVPVVGWANGTAYELEVVEAGTWMRQYNTKTKESKLVDVGLSF